MSLLRRPVVVQIDGKVSWVVSRDPDSKGWVGVCPPLNLTAEGDTFEELNKSQIEAMALLFADLFAEGELEAFLRRNHWAAALPKPGTKAKFDMPFEMRTDSVERMMGALT